MFILPERNLVACPYLPIYFASNVVYISSGCLRIWFLVYSCISDPSYIIRCAIIWIRRNTPTLLSINPPSAPLFIHRSLALGRPPIISLAILSAIVFWCRSRHNLCLFTLSNSLARLGRSCQRASPLHYFLHAVYYAQGGSVSIWTLKFAR